ncbi:MAG: hypothetical protein ABSC06_20520 [Rhodopila sp.]
MPNVPYTGVTDVTPSVQQPSDYFTQQATPNDFGAQVGQAVQGLGQAGVQAGEAGLSVATAFQGLNNEATARDGGVALAKNMGDIWSNYRQKEGQAGFQGYGDFVNQLQQARDDAVNAMPNLQARSMLSQQSAYLVDRWQMSGATYAADQRKVWMIQSHQAAQENAQTQGVLFQNQPDVVIANGHNLADSVGQELRMRDPLIDQATVDAGVSAAKGKYYANVIGSLVQTDPGAAESLFNRVRGEMDGPSIEATGARLQGVAAAARGVSAAQEELGRPAPSGGAPGSGSGTPTTVFNALVGTEASSPDAVSPKGAAGSTQIIESTFNQYKLAGESYGNEDDRRAAARRYVDDMWKQHPNDPARVAVGYFSGVNNIAPPGSPTPWINDTNDGTPDKPGTTVSQYVQRFTGKLGTGPPGAAQPATPQTTASAPAAVTTAQPDISAAPAPAAQGDSRSAILQRTIERTNGDPIAQEAAVRHLDTVFRAQDADRIDAERDHQMRQQMAKDVSDTEETKIQSTLGTHPDQVTAQDILTNKNLLPDARQRMVNFVERQTKPDPLATVSAQTANALSADLSRPWGDPLKTKSLAPITDAYNAGRLSRADYDDLTKRFNEAQTPDGVKLTNKLDTFLAAVKPSIEKSNPLMGQLDMTGGVNFLTLRNDVEKKIADYRRDNLNPYDLFDPSKQDFVGKPDALLPYQKSIPESMAEIANRMRAQQTPVAPPPAKTAPPTGKPRKSLDQIFGTPGAAAAAGP